jgi:xanthine/uracil permease
MVTAAFVGVVVVLIGLALSAYAINVADGQDEWKLRGFSDRFHRGG